MIKAKKKLRSGCAFPLVVIQNSDSVQENKVLLMAAQDSDRLTYFFKKADEKLGEQEAEKSG